MTRLVVVLVSAVALLASGAAPGPDAEAAKTKPRKVCVIKKPGRKAVRRPCRGPVKRRTTIRRTAAPAPSSVPAAPGLVPVADAAPAAGSAPAASGETPAADAATCVPAASPWLGATASDTGGFRLLVSRTCVPAGQVLVQLRNLDEQPHNLYVEGVAPAAPARLVVADIDPQVVTQGSVALGAGRWRFFCAIAGHEAMTATVTAS